MGPFKHPCVVIYRFACSICNKIDESQVCHVPAGGEALVCHAPDGWVALFGSTLICPDHKIETVFVDGKNIDTPLKFADLPDGHYWVRWDEINSYSVLHQWRVASKTGWYWSGSGIPSNMQEPDVVGVAIQDPEQEPAATNHLEGDIYARMQAFLDDPTRPKK